jgi:hypothetical protein
MDFANFVICSMIQICVFLYIVDIPLRLAHAAFDSFRPLSLRCTKKLQPAIDAWAFEHSLGLLYKSTNRNS